MNFVLSSVLGHHTLAYLDVVVYSRGFSQHLKDLEETLQLLAAAGLKLNIEKCKFAATTINFLGFTISPGVSPHQDEVAAILATLAPRTVKEPDFTQPFELHTDASSITLGAALIQRDHDGTPHAIAYYNRKLRDPETRYPATDSESLAVMFGELSSQELALEQCQDPALQDILSYLSDGTVPKKKPPVSL
nr:uncharacterized protein LOC113802694 [Penaeus vannamei]